MQAANQVLTVAQMLAAEQALIDAGSSVERLMKIAGEGAAEQIWRICGGRAVTVLCGPGNNGGDGYVIAESLRKRGCEITVVAPFEAKTDAAKAARKAYLGEVHSSADDVGGDTFVDCLFGSGLSRPLGDELIKLIQSLHHSHTISVAVDLPSGVDADTGDLLNDRIPRYQHTLALGAWKFAHYIMPAMEHLGRSRLVDIGIEAVNGAAQAATRPAIIRPSGADHKYTRGLVAVIAGQMSGAAQLAARAAANGGAGYVKLLNGDAIASAPHIVAEGGDVQTALTDHRIGAILVGPGLGRSPDAESMLKLAFMSAKPTVFDADALHLIGKGTALTKGSIATPHEGEMAAVERNFGLSSEGSKVERARNLAAKSGIVIVAKGADTIVASPSGETVLCPAATSWLSTAGTGDVLAGLIAARLATGMPAMEAALQGVWLHGRAAQHAGAAFTASNLTQHIQKAISECL